MICGTLRRSFQARQKLRRFLCTTKEGVARNVTKKSWVPNQPQNVEKVTKQSIIYEMEDLHRQTVRAIVPWFLKNMPSAYFRQVNGNLRLEHLRMFAAMYSADVRSDLSLSMRNPSGNLISTIRPSNAPGMLMEDLASLRHEQELTSAEVFTSFDEKFCVNIFGFGKKPLYDATKALGTDRAVRFAQYIQELREGKYEDDLRHPKPTGCLESEEALQRVMAKCPAEFIMNSSPRRLAKQLLMIDQVSGKESTLVDLEAWSGGDENAEGNLRSMKPHYMLTIAAPNVVTLPALRKIVALCTASGLDITRSHVNVINDAADGRNVAMVRLVVQQVDTAESSSRTPTRTNSIKSSLSLGGTDTPVSHHASSGGSGGALRSDAAWSSLLTDISRLKWVDDRVLDMMHSNASMDLLTAEVIVGLCGLVHCNLNQEALGNLSRQHVLSKCLDFLPLSTDIAQLFLDRHNPDGPISDAEFTSRRSDILSNVHQTLQLPATQHIFESMLDGVAAVLRTNVYVPDRFSLACRLDPAFCKTGVHTDQPFGVFFVNGRRFNGFHVRFRDIARGGLRLVAPSNPEQYGMDAMRLYDEVYALARAQQLKNKDIPEGGSKAVCLVDVTDQSDEHRETIMRRCCKAFADGLLSLISPDPAVKDRVVDYYGDAELIYLGPDENIIPQDIDYVIGRAAERAYPIPAAFMSSKAEAGINHKEYGVTSEGVQVFLDTALKHTGVLPTSGSDAGDGFSVKLTGGPDGDVCGNAIRIMHREYGDAVRIVGLADGSGCAEDPQGLDMDELLRLVEDSAPIVHFNAAKLSSGGRLIAADSVAGVRARNTMHNRVFADAFVPAGGRPGTINLGNWQEFLLEDGRPSSPVIVEGANLFVEPLAREKLSAAGVMIVKDSSANKCGVICSSFEIVASMMLSTEEFVDCKEELVTDVLTRLRQLARLEAELLFREAAVGVNLPALSERISASIIRSHDAISGAIDSLPGVQRDALIDGLVREHLPDSLLEVAFDQNRLRDRVPWAYVKNMVAAPLAAKIVYNEGVEFVEDLNDRQLIDVAFGYFDSQKHIESLIGVLDNAEGLDASASVELKHILRRVGIRAALEMRD